MRPLEPGENLLLPNDERHTCPHCGLWARGASNIDLVFGFRRMGDAASTVRVVPWCKRCRVKARRGRLPATSDADMAEFERVRGARPGVVYAIHALDRGLTKLGFTQAEPRARLRQLQTACPDELMLIGYYGADYFAETELHAELREHHHRGEWFWLDAREARALLVRHGAQLAINDNIERREAQG